MSNAQPAADPGRGDSGALEEVLVTAYKREESINKVGMTITAL